MFHFHHHDQRQSSLTVSARHSWLLILVVGMMIPLNGFANPFHIGRFGGIVDSGATSRSPFSIYWNPAGLTDVGFTLQLHGMLVNRKATYDRDAELNEVPSELEGINSGVGKAGTLGAVPGLALQSGHDLGNWSIGLGIAGFVERAGRTNWKKNFAASQAYPGAVDGPQRWAVINTELTMLSLGVGLAVEHVESALSFGATIFGTQTTLSLLRARTVNSSDDVTLEGYLAEGRVLFEDGEDQGFTLILGTQWQPTSNFKLGLAWQSAVSYTIKGDAYILFGEAEETQEPAQSTLDVPQSIRSEISVTLSPLITLRPSLSWHQWSIAKSQTAVGTRTGEILFRTPRDFNDTYEFKLNTDLQVTDIHALHIMLGIENGATPKETFEPGLAESTNARFGGGWTAHWSETLKTHIAFVWQAFADVTVTDSQQMPLTNGRYTDHRQFLTVDMEIAL
ncbi:MAG: OmpP1/FadL family transporter [Bradymonadia bacterium]